MILPFAALILSLALSSCLVTFHPRPYYRHDREYEHHHYHNYDRDREDDDRR